MRNSPRHLSHPSQSQGYWASLRRVGGRIRIGKGTVPKVILLSGRRELPVSGEFLLRAHWS